jgi:hypothetical protein
MIHCVGDSHTTLFTEQAPDWYSQGYPTYNPINPPFQVHWLGPHTAYNLCKRKPIIDDIVKSFWKPNDFLMFVTGEIDCRAHIVKQSKLQNRTIEEISRECCNRFFDFILTYKSFNLIIYFSVPTTMTGEESKKASKLYNEELEKLSFLHGLPFVCIPEVVCGPLWYPDGTHLSPILALPIIKKQITNIIGCQNG